MKRTFAMITLALILAMSACGAERDAMTTTQTMTELTTEPTTEPTIESTTEPTIESTTEPTINLEVGTVTEEWIVVCEFEDLHPLYQQCGYPDRDVKAWISAEEVQPTIEKECPHNWGKCVYAGDFGGTEVNAYLYMADGIIGTWLVNSKGEVLDVYGVAFQGVNRDWNIQLKLPWCEEEGCCSTWVWPREEGYQLVVNQHNKEGNKESIENKTWPEVPATLETKAPCENAKCVYTGNFGGTEVNAYLYEDDGILGTWLVNSKGEVLDVYGYVFWEADDYEIALVATENKGGGRALIWPNAEGGYTIVA